MVLKQLLAKIRAKREAFKEVQQEDRIQTLVQQRKKNSNERELERYIEEDRQKQILEDLKMYRKKRTQEVNGMKILGGKNIFKGHKSMLTDNKKLFNMRNGLGLSQEGMYFR